MEIIRKDTDYAIRALLHLALSDGREVSCSKLARSCGTPRTVTYKVMGRLVAAGLVVSRAGRTGGFRLSRRAGRSTLLDTVNAVQGPLTVSRCVIKPALCPQHNGCPVSKKWAALQRGLVDTLAQTSVDDLVGALKRGGASVGVESRRDI